MIGKKKEEKKKKKKKVLSVRLYYRMIGTILQRDHCSRWGPLYIPITLKGYIATLGGLMLRFIAH